MVPLKTIHTAKEYDKAVYILNQLLDAGAANESLPLTDLANSRGSFIGDYENTHHALSVRYAVCGSALSDLTASVKLKLCLTDFTLQQVFLFR